jgi:phage gpG-like protein
MPQVSIRLNLAQSKHVQDALREVLGRLGGGPGGSGLLPLNKALATYMRNAVKQRIGRYKVGPDGTPWAPLKPSTIALRARIGKMSAKDAEMMHFPIMQDSGDLLKGIDIGYVSAKGFEIKSRSPHSSYMQFGVEETSGFIPGKSVPARPFLGYSDENKRMIRKKINAFIKKGEL